MHEMEFKSIKMRKCISPAGEIQAPGFWLCTPKQSLPKMSAIKGFERYVNRTACTLYLHRIVLVAWTLQDAFFSSRFNEKFATAMQRYLNSVHDDVNMFGKRKGQFRVNV